MNLPRMLLVVFVLLLVSTAVAAGLALTQGRGAARPETAPTSGPVVAPRPEVSASELLRSWDRRRASAWAAGDDAALAALYTRRSAAGRRDREMLDSWLARGLRVTGMRMQVVELQVVSRTSTRLVLDLTDRLAGATVRGAGEPLTLPRDAATSRRLELRWVDAQWRMASVRPSR